MRICGIDPGMKGALAFISCGNVEVVYMPTKIGIVDRQKVNLKRNLKKARMILLPGVLNIFMFLLLFLLIEFG